ncbi:MAG: hypothetical protein K8S87_03835 [Planctomycetes bacterium]|nr:hypothetical protein [Planctomycetota bacterium]
MKDYLGKDVEDRGRVSTVGSRWKIDGGFFHFTYPNRPIRNPEGKLVGITNPRDMTYIHTYGGEAIFFESLGKGKLIATKCVNPKCAANGSIFMPFRIHCPDCLEKAELIDITDIAKKSSVVHSFMITERTGAYNTLPKPIRFINIEFDGVCTILMGYMSVGEPKMGMHVVPIFNTKAPTFTILDLSWVVEGTTAEQLPENFTF